MRRNVVYLVGCLVIVIGTFVATLVSGNTPQLGLDLQGGISVVLSPVGDYRSSSVDVAVDIIRNRVDSIGVAEPEISRQGDDIVVDLPGVKDRAQAERLVGRTAELRFRPVLQVLPPESDPNATTTTSTTPGGSTTTLAPGETTTTTTTAAPVDDAAARAAIASCDATAINALPSLPTTKVADEKSSDCVVYPGRVEEDGPRVRYLLGPTALTGKGVDSARRQFSAGTGYEVIVDFTGDGLISFNQLASELYNEEATKGAKGSAAIVLDGVVQSAPQIQSPTFDGSVQITGNFSGDEATDLSRLINYGALPVRLEKVNVQNVSPTLGQDQLDAGIIAGIIGLLLVALYMLVYYRILGLVVIGGVLLTGMALYTMVSYLGQSIGLTLTLAGVTGIIVSVGVTVDSYIVYFERLKDEVRAGSTVRTCVDRAFHRSFKTILAADLVSILGAAILYWLAIGGVRGFAFFLGLSTLLDLVISYFFMHPVVSILARRPHLVRMKGIGIAAGLDAEGVQA